MATKSLHIAWTLILLVSGLTAFSQQAPSLKASIDRNNILIGEPIQLMLEARLPAGSNFVWFSTDSIPHFEFIEKGKIDTVNGDIEKSFRQHIVITSFDSGIQVIPPLLFIADNKNYYTDSIRIDVGFSNYDPKKDYHDIKDIIDIENPYVRYIVWAITGISLISLALVIFLIRGKVAPLEEPGVPVSKFTPYEEAVRALQELKQQRLAQSGQVKLYYTTLNDILRRFVMRKLNIASMEKTNEELILQLRQLSMSSQQFAQLAEALRMSDSVKFAKYLPGESDNERNFGIIETSVHLLNEMEK
jgi:hypothetical protein